MGFKPIPVRYVISFLAFVGTLFNYMMRNNINMAIVTMVNYTALAMVNTNNVTMVNLTMLGELNTNMDNATDLRMDEGGTKDTKNSALQDGPFLWDSIAINQIIGSFYWGYVILQIPGGRLAEVMGGKRVLAVTMAGTALLTLLIPPATKMAGPDGYPYLLIIIRTSMGVLEGTMFPCITAMLTKWAPAQERSVMTTFIFSGVTVGIVISYQMVGAIANSLGWESIFYIQGSTCFLWVAAWCWYASDTPSTHPSISKEEKDYITSSLSTTSSKSPPIPLKHMFLSLPFWAILVANFCNNWGIHLVMSQLPQYYSQVFKKKLSENALWNSLPYLFSFFTSLAVAKTADFLMQSSIMSRGNVRKLWNTVGLGGCGICLLIVLLSNTEDNKEETVTKIMFILGIVCMGAVMSGFLTNIQDIAPNFAGTILGITNSIGSVCGWVAPMVSGLIVNEDPSNVSLWRIVWITAVTILLTGATFYLIFASGETQAWNNLKLDQRQGDKEEAEIMLTTVQETSKYN